MSVLDLRSVNIYETIVVLLRTIHSLPYMQPFMLNGMIIGVLIRKQTNR